ncbi:hypothetical protein NL676_012680 [Syzygium grande]|nr:hypothetical protein NL676_012680 [Syzygium grande]
MASNVMMLVVFTILAISSFLNEAHWDPIVPCYFIFGDSLADNGNNNMLNTAAKADFPPYRVDLPGVGSSGRFTNGRTMIDFIGVNYTSASSGIRDDTGSNLGDHISLNKQLKNHRNVINSINSSLGDLNETARLLNSCLYSVGVGNNDYINDYFPSGNRSGEDTPEQFASLLIDE